MKRLTDAVETRMNEEESECGIAGAGDGRLADPRGDEQLVGCRGVQDIVLHTGQDPPPVPFNGEGAVTVRGRRDRIAGLEVPGRGQASSAAQATAKLSGKRRARAAAEKQAGEQAAV